MNGVEAATWIRNLLEDIDNGREPHWLVKGTEAASQLLFIANLLEETSRGPRMSPEMEKFGTEAALCLLFAQRVLDVIIPPELLEDDGREPSKRLVSISRPKVLAISKEIFKFPISDIRFNSIWELLPEVMTANLHPTCLVWEYAHQIHHCLYRPDAPEL